MNKILVVLLFWLFSLSKDSPSGLALCQEAFNRRFLCAVLDLSGILCSLLIPEYSGIKRRGKPLSGAEESRHFLH